MSDTAVIVSVVVALLALTGTVVSVLVAKQQKERDALFEDRQAAQAEALDNLRREVADLRAKYAEAEARIARLERRDRQWANYVHVLRRHINDRQPPPPPEWPPGLDV